jgi:hypothetical protein
LYNKNVLVISIVDSIAYEKMLAALTNTRLMNGIKKASPFGQTSALEGFHSVLNQFSPKMIGYSYRGMFCRYRHIKHYGSDFACFIYLTRQFALKYLGMHLLLFILTKI